MLAACCFDRVCPFRVLAGCLPITGRAVSGFQPRADGVLTDPCRCMLVVPRLVFCGHWGVYNSTEVWYSDDGGNTYALSQTVFQRMDECACHQSRLPHGPTCGAVALCCVVVLWRWCNGAMEAWCCGVMARWCDPVLHFGAGRAGASS